MADNTLPASSSARWDGYSLRCPWCASTDVSEARVSLEQLLCAHCNGQLERWAGGPNRTADDCDVTADCPACGKPFIVTLRKDWDGEPIVRLDPVRTAADARLLTGG